MPKGKDFPRIEPKINWDYIKKWVFNPKRPFKKFHLTKKVTK